MKRTVPLIVLIGAAGLLVPILGASGESPNRSSCKGQWASGCPDGTYAYGCCAKAPSDGDNVVGELTAILKETKSTETFLVTAMVLGRMGPEAKRAIPAIIRNAERLELLEDLYSTRASAENRNLAAQEVIAALDMILDKKAGTKGRIWQSAAHGYYGTVAPAACAPCCPPPTSSIVPSSWNAPATTPTPAPASGSSSLGFSK